MIYSVNKMLKSCKPYTNQASNTIETLQTVISTEKSKMESMVENMIEGVIMIDEKGEIVVLNSPARQMLGFGLDENVTSEALFEKKKAIGLDKCLEECKEKKSPITKEIVIPSKDNQVLHCEISPVKGLRDEVVGMVTVLRDITKEKELNKLKGDFISTVSHELRTPLTVIKESVSLVLDGILGETTEKQKKIMGICLEDIDRLRRIIDTLLDISKIDAGKVQINRELIDLVALVKGISSEFMSQAKRKGLEIRENLPLAPVEVYADRDRIVQVFTNLVGNALKFTPPERKEHQTGQVKKGYIEISVIDKEEDVECSVSDTGKGISKEDLPKVFGRFQQFDRVAGPGEKGTGLGLAISKSIVELHGGIIGVESKLNEGTKFTFALPKYGKDEVLYGEINNRITTARKEHEELSIFVFRIDNYAEIEKDSGEKEIKNNISQILQDLRNIIKQGEFVSLKNNNEIIISFETTRNDISKITKRIKRVIKESAIKIDKNCVLNFSYGYAVYPEDGNTAKELIAKTTSNLVSEEKERLLKSIMIVDDEPDIVKMLKRELKIWGYNNLSEACDGEEALEKIRTLIPDLVILDMMMPKMSGYEVIGRLKEDVLTQDIPILIVSAVAVEISKLDEINKKKAIPMIRKPFDDKEVKKWVDYLL